MRNKSFPLISCAIVAQCFFLPPLLRCFLQWLWRVVVRCTAQASNPLLAAVGVVCADECGHESVHCILFTALPEGAFQLDACWGNLMKVLSTCACLVLQGKVFCCLLLSTTTTLTLSPATDGSSTRSGGKIMQRHAEPIVSSLWPKWAHTYSSQWHGKMTMYGLYRCNALALLFTSLSFLFPSAFLSHLLTFQSWHNGHERA